MTWSSLYFVARFLKRKLSPAFSVLGQDTCPRLGNQGPDQDEFGRSDLWPRVWIPGTELQLCALCCSSLPSSPSLIPTPELERAHEPAWDPERENQRSARPPAICVSHRSSLPHSALCLRSLFAKHGCLTSSFSVALIFRHSVG